MTTCSDCSLSTTKHSEQQIHLHFQAKLLFHQSSPRKISLVTLWNLPSNIITTSTREELPEAMPVRKKSNRAQPLYQSPPSRLTTKSYSWLMGMKEIIKIEGYAWDYFIAMEIQANHHSFQAVGPLFRPLLTLELRSRAHKISRLSMEARDISTLAIEENFCKYGIC
uniref:Uncharacterized protein n=1 Tax=Cannabis sativa TaxID=3483 RepID=A0A803NMQ6_CANSA